MREFKLSKIWILSDIEKSGNAFIFSPRINLITSKDNSVGKSSLVKTILWTFGCQPYFDSDWNISLNHSLAQNPPKSRNIRFH